MDLKSIPEPVCLEKYQKCGFIYRSPTIKDEQYMILSCLYCNNISWKLDEFLQHLDNVHPIKKSSCTLFKEQVNEEKLLVNYNENIGEKSINSHIDKIVPKDSQSVDCLKDPLDEKHYDYNDFLPNDIKIDTLDEAIYKDTISKKEYNNKNFEINECIYDNSSNEEDFEGDKDTSDSENDDNNDEYLNEHYDEDDNDEDEFSEDEVLSQSVGVIENKKTNLKRFTKNREFIKAVIDGYQKEILLWDSAYKTKKISSPEKQKALRNILKEINDKFKIKASLKQIERIIKRLRLRYLHQTRLRDSGQTYKPLWFLDLLTFLDPHFKENKLKNGVCKQLKDEQFLTLIKLFKENECFWNENNIYHTSALYRQEILKSMANNFSNICKLKDFNTDIMQNTIDELLEMAKEENVNKLNHLARNTDEEYQSTNKFYKDILFLLPHVGPFNCKQCPKNFTDIYAYKFHISRHEGTKPFKCMICPRELTHKKEFICHLRRHTKECPFQCDSCDKSFPSKKEWHRHVIKHGSKPYVCELCADSFYTQHQLTNHMKNHNNIRDHVCPECGKGFTHRGLLRQHLQTHNKTKCFCPLCKNIYSNPRSLRKHYVRVHEVSQEPSSASLTQYNCKICKITFTTLQDANQHRKEHKQSNPVKRKHICDICGHHFAYPRNLADHKKTHSNIRDQVCDVCGKAFTNTNLLNQHKNVHNREKFVCKACGKDYAHYRGLCRHITKVHNTNIKDLDAILEKQKLEINSSLQ